MDDTESWMFPLAVDAQSANFPMQAKSGTVSLEQRCAVELFVSRRKVSNQPNAKTNQKHLSKLGSKEQLPLQLLDISHVSDMDKANGVCLIHSVVHQCRLRKRKRLLQMTRIALGTVLGTTGQGCLCKASRLFLTTSNFDLSIFLNLDN